MIWGGTIFGNCASGSPRTAMMPTITIMIEITIATMGRLMKKLEIMDKASPTGFASAKVVLAPANAGLALVMVGLAMAKVGLGPANAGLALVMVGLGPANAGLALVMVGLVQAKVGLVQAKARQTALD